MTLARPRPPVGTFEGTPRADEEGHDVGAGQIWTISALLGAGAATVFALLIWGLSHPAHHLPFLPVVALFAVAEISVVHLEMGSHSHTYSPVEIPLVLGLLGIDPKLLPAAWLIGGAVAVGVVRRQTPIRLAYNLVCFAVESLAALLVFRAFTDGADLTSGRTLGAALAAAMTASAVSIASVLVAVGTTEGPQPRREQVRYAGFGLASTSVTTALMLIGVVLYQTDSRSLWLLIPPVVAAFFLHRAFAASRGGSRGVDRSTAAVVDEGAPGWDVGLPDRATHDPLTGLINHAMLVEHLSRILEPPDASDVACLLIDLDDFREVNETFGRATGDQLIVVTAQRLVRCLRESDVACRLGADRLAVVAHVSPDDSIREATTLAHRIAESLGRPASLGADMVTATTGIGIAIRGEGDTPEVLLGAARSALAAAKRSGKGRVQVLSRSRAAEPVRR